MAKRRGIIGATTALLLIAGALVSVTGCAQRSETSFDQGAARAAEQTGSVAASIAAAAAGTTDATAAQAASGTAAAAASGAAAGGSASGLSAEMLTPWTRSSQQSSPNSTG